LDLVLGDKKADAAGGWEGLDLTPPQRDHVNNLALSATTTQIK
jgi:hypothetical protein